MKRSQINRAFREAAAFFAENCWALPPAPRWDITDFGLGDFDRFGLVLVNLATEPEYCEKLMFARRSQKTPAHTHTRKKEDIICRVGRLAVQVWSRRPGAASDAERFELALNGSATAVRNGEVLVLPAGHRVTLVPGVYHEFYPLSDRCIIGEVSTANDDLHDNIFVDERIGRFTTIDEDEPALVRLVSE
jgi:D-lyxose ketol-isomerase